MIHYFFMLLCCFNMAMVVGSNQEFFLQGNALYHQKKYSEALDRYHLITPHNATVWYNMGACSFMQENYLEALRCWYHVQQNPFFKKLTEEKIQSITDLLQIPYDYSYFDYMAGFIKHQPMFFWQILCIIFIYIFLLAYFFDKKKISLCLIFLITINSICLSVYYKSTSELRGYCVRNCDLLTGKNNNFSPLAHLVAGQIITILDKQEEWYKIKTKSNKCGWILMDNIETL